MTTAERGQFYVYEHWRSDTNKCFYVGKGQRRRAHDMTRGRNRFHQAIVAKLTQAGLPVVVVIVATYTDESEAYRQEVLRIELWRKAGIRLANLAEGGGRNSGWHHSEERRKAIGDSKRGNSYRLGAVLTAETREKIAAPQRGRTLREEHKRLIAQQLSGEKNPFFGKKHTAEVGQIIAAANRRRVWTAESKAKLSATLKGRKRENNSSGWRHSPEVRARMSAAAKRRWARQRQADAPR